MGMSLFLPQRVPAPSSKDPAEVPVAYRSRAPSSSIERVSGGNADRARCSCPSLEGHVTSHCRGPECCLQHNHQWLQWQVRPMEAGNECYLLGSATGGHR